MKTLGAARFWTEFRTAFQSSSGNPTTEVGIHYRKFRDRGSEESDTEWTHLMGAFLSRLAITLGFYQEWEPLDFVWYEEDRMKPSVAIEHENDWHAKIRDSEVPKLLRHPAPLKLLITYLDPPKPVAGAEVAVSNILKAVEEVFQSSRKYPAGEFAVVIGGGLEEPRDWIAFVWSTKKRGWTHLK